MITAGALRRLTQPILFRYWLTRATNKTTATRIDGFELQILPTVFHPKYFGSSVFLGRFIESLGLDEKIFLDMGTGSGIVGLFAARSGARVTAVDINPQAVRCAASNAEATGLTIDCRQSDLFSALNGQQFDVIAWNPPFFPKSAGNVVEAALYAGEEYAVIARFARDSRAHLKHAGRIFLILSMDIDVARIESMFTTAKFSVRRALTKRWGLAEKMVIIEIALSPDTK